MSGDFLCIEFEGSSKCEDSKDKLQRIYPFANSPVYNTTIKRFKLLSHGDDVNVVYDMILSLEGIEYKFEPGDTIGILPCNDEQEVKQLLDRLKLTSVARETYQLSILKETFKKKPVIPGHIPTLGTIYELFSKHLDIHSVPKKMFLKTLARYTSNDEEIEKLNFLGSIEGSKDYIQFVTENRTLLDVLKSFPTCFPPVERLLEHLPALQPRPYSISSSPLVNQTEIHVTFSVVQNGDIKGVCSSWLENILQYGNNLENSRDILLDLKKLNINSGSVPFYFRKYNDFRLPIDTSTPIIMVGAGTGIAPFMGFLQHRSLLLKEGLNCGSSWLFYGCRYSDRDFLYKKEVETFLECGVLSKLITAFSRDGSNKVYVQHVMKEHGESLVNKLVKESAIVYICGDMKNMIQEVKDGLISCLTEFNGMVVNDATEYVKNLVKTKRFIQDVWI